MSTISSLGVGSGLDIRGIVDDLVQAERAPQENRLNRQEERLETELSAMGQVESALGQFREAVQAAQGGFETIAADSTSDAVSVSAGDDAEPGSVELDVQQLARGQSLAVGPEGVERDEQLGGGSLTFRFGEVTPGEEGGVEDFTPSDSRGTVSINIDPAESSLEEIRDAVNAADGGVRASIVNDGTQDRLVFNSTDTGADSGFVVDVDADDAGGQLEALAFNEDNAASALLNRSAQDAELSVDGLAITRSSNELDDILPGTSITLDGTTDGPATVSVSEDSSGAAEGVQAFVEGFNELQTQINELTRFDPETEESGPLNGDPLLRGLTSQLRNELTQPLDELEGRAVRSLADVGILTTREGTLELDEARLEDALQEDPRAVEALFSQSTGLVEGDGFSLRSASGSAEPGRFDVEVTEAATRGSLENLTTGEFPFDPDDADSSFRVIVDGERTELLDLPGGEINSADELAAELARTINGAEAVRSGGLGVEVEALEDGSLRIRSNSFGEESTIAFEDVGADLRDRLSLDDATSTAGSDVQGTIGGVEATGEGLQLTAFDGPAAGLSLDTQPDAFGELGTLAFSRGSLAGVDRVLDRFLGADGVIGSQTDSLNNRLERVAQGRERLDDRMEQVEARYNQQFGRLDGLVSELQQTGEFLEQQLAGLNQQ
ncbi:flagellar filament capping protein FliD [Aquisalimonas sp. 2447]|uniref:flagellar filament capping protein FliD n=1 Tax=Aquisalimonas sp. 2447 TaxID=2740807 RepID=UPI001432591C|nr:flagellar filament capping protein FliD [Aquisalimonas sp. 2447]QIT55710.1 flagellar filament capping protein FliD [Aquisalimonas sp. 2447]